MKEIKTNLFDRVKALNKDELDLFFKKMVMLHRSFGTAIPLRGPYTIALDNNIFCRIDEIEESKPLTPTHLALLVFFEWLKQQKDFPSIDLVVFATVFYEYNRRKEFEHFNQHWEIFKKIRNSFEDYIGISLQFESITDHNATAHLFALIKNDEELIINEINRVKTAEYSLKFIDKKLRKNVPREYYKRVPLFEVIDYLRTPLELRYFHRGVTQRFIDQYILHQLENNEEIRSSFMWHKSGNDWPFREVLKVHKNQLKGLGDLELFSRANLKSQFELQRLGNTHHAHIPLTLDEKLLELLDKASILNTEWRLETGKDNDKIKTVLEQDWDDRKRRIPLAEENLDKFYAGFRLFFDDYLKLLPN